MTSEQPIVQTMHRPRNAPFYKTTMSESPHVFPKAMSNGDLSSVVEGFNKKSVLNKMNSTFSSSEKLSSSSSSQMMSKSSSVVSKKSQMLHSMSSSSSQERLKQQQEQSNEVFQENRNFSRSVSLSSSSDSRLKMLSSSQRGFSVEEPLSEEEDPMVVPVVTTSSREGSPPQEMRFEQKRLASSSHCKVSSSDGFTAEKSTSNNKELKRMVAGDLSYEEKHAASAMKARLESDGFAAEKLSAHQMDQKQFKAGDSVLQNQQRMAKATALKVSTDEFTTEKVAMAKQEERQLFSQGMMHQERNMSTSTSSKVAFSSKNVKSSSLSCSSQQQVEFGSTSSSLVGSPIITSPLEQLMLPSTSPSQQAIMKGLTEDLELLSGSPSDEQMKDVTARMSQRMESCLERLKAAVTSEEATPLLRLINDIIRQSWAVPTVGYDLGFTLCNILRNQGGLDILIGNCDSADDELLFGSLQVLEQCLSTENRAYVVQKGLCKVVSAAVACSTRSSVSHSRIGTGILEHLFKHSEGTCSDVIRMGGLKAILYDCRTSDVDTLRHCAAALANLSLYGGPENQQAMINKKAPMWLFPLAFHMDDNIKYYACLAIAALVANKEIEAAVLRSGTLDLVEPFVSSHSPEDFAASSVAHVHGQSKNWLLRLVPVLGSKREEARSLAAFHFAMEAGIKKKQGNTTLFYEIGAVESLKKVASSPNAIASRYAAQALQLIGESVPHKLSQQVPLWAVEDVNEWVKQIGFMNYCQQFSQSRVDGDLLLQLTEEMLMEDIGIKNGILRKRFLRELSQLKRMSDYSSCDTTNLNQLLLTLGPDFSQYTYPMLQCGVDRDTLRFLSEDQLARECGIDNTIHRLRIGQAIRGLISSQSVEDDETTTNKSLDVFVSYRRSNGSQLASLLKVHLQLRGFSVFIDVERLEAGKFDNNLLQSIQQAKHFLLVLTPNALDRCQGDNECKDWVHREIVEALQSQCNIIPILDSFQWPEPESLPEDMRAVSYFNGVRWIHDYQDACVDKLERFMRGEMNVRSDGPLGRYVGMGGPGTPSTPSTTLTKVPVYQRSASNDSTKGSTCSDKDSKEAANSTGRTTETNN